MTGQNRELNISGTTPLDFSSFSRKQPLNYRTIYSSNVFNVGAPTFFGSGVVQVGSTGYRNFDPKQSPVVSGHFGADDLFTVDEWVIPRLPQLAAEYDIWISAAERAIEKSPKVEMKATKLPRVGTAPENRKYSPLQQWEGVVTQIGNETFWANLCDLTNPNSPRESAEIYWDEVPEADRTIVEVGSVFYWTIGYLHDKGGRLERTAEIRLRRLPKWSKKDIDEAKRKAMELLKQLA